MNFAELFIKRPITTTLIMLGICVFGVMAYQLLPVSDLPTVDPAGIAQDHDDMQLAIRRAINWDEHGGVDVAGRLEVICGGQRQILDMSAERQGDRAVDGIDTFVGELDDPVKALGWQRLVIVRPSSLRGPRTDLRLAERLGCG